MRHAAWATFALLACSSGADPVRTVPSCTDCPEAGKGDAAAVGDALDEATAPEEASGGKRNFVGDAGVVQLPTANGDVCPVSASDDVVLACFASDPAPYDTYLGSFGPAVGQCPQTTDFNENRCAACGPIEPFAAAAFGAGLANACCYVVLSGCGP